METDKYISGIDPYLCTDSNGNKVNGSLCVMKVHNGKTNIVEVLSLKQKPYWLQNLWFKYQVLRIYLKYGIFNTKIVKEKNITNTKPQK